MIKYLRFKTKFQIEELLEKTHRNIQKNDRVEHLFGKINLNKKI